MPSDANDPLALTITRDLLAAKQELTNRYFGRGHREGVTAAALHAGATTPDPDYNLVGIGFGEKVTDAGPTCIPAVKFFVRTKLPPSRVASHDRLPAQLNGQPTDVEEIGTVVRFGKVKAAAAVMPDPKLRYRPARPGCSVGFRKVPPPGEPERVMSGTFGAVVIPRGRGGARTPCILSNNHVLADENRLPEGAPIYQPGLLDGGDPAQDQIAQLFKFIPLKAAKPNKVDAAIASALKPRDVDPSVMYINVVPSGIAPATLDLIVHKFGRTTRYTVGRVTAVDADLYVGYETGSFLFTGQIVIQSLTPEPFSAPGDSGSIILERVPARRGRQRAVGLLFAGSGTHTIANPIREVLNALKIDFA